MYMTLCRYLPFINYGDGRCLKSIYPLPLDFFSTIPWDLFESPQFSLARHEPALDPTNPLDAEFGIISQFNLIFKQSFLGFVFLASSAPYLSRALLWGGHCSCCQLWGRLEHFSSVASFPQLSLLSASLFSAQCEALSPAEGQHLPWNCQDMSFYIQFALQQDGACYQVLFPLLKCEIGVHCSGEFWANSLRVLHKMCFIMAREKVFLVRKSLQWR